jgi:hypothetical protein
MISDYKNKYLNMVLLASAHKPENLVKFIMPIHEYSSISDSRGEENDVQCLSGYNY